ncbi:ATP synthase gamma chain [uncultured delta proteobacterium]|uniref:ATP synthase gamma chain n=1 Tax=uncultured delta proteobacterium TaxID=34034 RepID=A0A212KBX4_9DELT|nr:ATP synthase gamma chain [uncultured delta proteobacterium]
MASLKDVRNKISGVGKTKQITKAMNMVASAKLRGAQSRMEKFRAYADRFHGVLQNLAASDMELVHPLLVPHEEVKTIGIILVTSDRGLAGAFNINIIAEAFKLAKAKQAEGKEVVFFCVGKKGRDAVRKSPFAIAKDMAGDMNTFDFSLADRTGVEIISRYTALELDEVYLVYSEFVSLMRQIPTPQRILPVVPKEVDANAPPQSRTEYTFEPAGQALMDVLLPRVVKALIYWGLLSTSTSEHAARMTAMDNATRNCDDLIRSLTRLFNKTRQAVITNELIDIVGGVEALKG